MSRSNSTTPRQQIIETVSYRAAQRNYEAWRNEIGDPTIESATYEYCQATEGVIYNPRPVDLDTLREMIDGFADKAARPAVYRYYMNATERALDLLERVIMREAADRLERMKDTYDYAQHMARIVPAEPVAVAAQTPEPSPPATTRQRNYDHVLVCDHCGELFHASRYDAKYCGATCRQKARREVQRRQQTRQRALDAIHDYLRIQPNIDAHERAIADLIGAIQSNSMTC